MKVSDIAFGFKRYALYERGMRPKSHRAITATVRMLSNWADTEQLERFDSDIVKAFLYWGREEKAWEARTFRNHLQYLRSYFRWCVYQGYLRTNPTDQIERPKLPARTPRCLNRFEVQTVLGHVRWYPWTYRFEGTRNETMLYFLTYTGLRLQEMLDLEWADVNLRSSEILVRLGKGQKDRMVPIHPRLLPILRHYQEARQSQGHPSRYVFTGLKSNLPLCGRDVREVCKKISQATGVYFTPHRLRHTFGRLAIEGGLSVFKIKEIMGHTEISTTQRYLSVSTENLKQSLAKTDLL